jgi:hypothetical protein
MVYDQALGFDRPCYWVEVNLCSACAGVEDAELIEELPPAPSSAQAPGQGHATEADCQKEERAKR